MGERLEPQVAAEHYGSRAYNTKERFCSFWHQLDEVLSLGPRTVLEVGPGAGVVTALLRRAGVEVTTVDIDPALSPDVVGSVTDLPFPDEAFDAALCSEVLEHLPWEDVPHALAELRRVARTGVVVSVPNETPWAGKAYPLYFGRHVDEVRRRIPAGRIRPLIAAAQRRARWRDALFIALVPTEWGLGGRTLELSRPPIPHRSRRLDFEGEHYWEIGVQDYPPERVRRALEDPGFEIAREFRVPENPWHHFFVLRPVPGRSPTPAGDSSPT